VGVVASLHSDQADGLRRLFGQEALRVEQQQRRDLELARRDAADEQHAAHQFPRQVRRSDASTPAPERVIVHRQRHRERGRREAGR